MIWTFNLPTLLFLGWFLGSPLLMVILLFSDLQNIRTFYHEFSVFFIHLSFGGFGLDLARILALLPTAYCLMLRSRSTSESSLGRLR
jgi:hypothetical protein